MARTTVELGWYGEARAAEEKENLTVGRSVSDERTAPMNNPAGLIERKSVSVCATDEFTAGSVAGVDDLATLARVERTMAEYATITKAGAENRAARAKF